MLFGANIVEAFPNAFLGVVVSDEDFLNRPKISRGGKFDWLYNRWIADGLFVNIGGVAGLPDDVARRCETERDHDIRAALICLLTAALVQTGNYAAIGDESSGYFFLPPIDLWASWARNGISKYLTPPPASDFHRGSRTAP